MAEKQSLVNREFIGMILPDKDTQHQGRYKVNVPELQPHMSNSTGIWCKNHVCRHRVSPSQVGVSGSYYPLQAGMSVIVKFFANHIESGFIDRVISDAYPETLPYKVIERDYYYQIIRTPRHNNLIAIYENDTASTNVPKNSIHIYYNNTRTTIVIDETGINVKTADNINMTVAGNVKVTVNGTADVKVTGNTNIQSSADINVKSAGTTNIQADGDINVKAGGNANVESGGNANVKAGGDLSVEGSSLVNVKSGGVLNIHGATVNIKGDGPVNIQGSGVAINGTAPPAGSASSASPASDATPADAPTLITLTDFEYFTRSSGK